MTVQNVEESPLVGNWPTYLPGSPLTQGLRPSQGDTYSDSDNRYNGSPVLLGPTPSGMFKNQGEVEDAKMNEDKDG